jgi:anti-sigma factor ChrR (cupin superfamily)
VLQGAFRTDKGRYGPGDFEEADENVEHAPVTLSFLFESVSWSL